VGIRAERKEIANARRLELKEELQQYMAEALDKEKGKPSEKLAAALLSADEWLRFRTHRFPQEAHMYRAAFLMLKREFKEQFANMKAGFLRRTVRAFAGKTDRNPLATKSK